LFHNDDSPASNFVDIVAKIDPTSSSSFSTLPRMGRLAQQSARRAWRTMLFAAIILSWALTPSSYRGENRNAIARQIVQGTTDNLVWFTVLCALVSLVLIRIVVVTAISYGLSRYALEMVVRVLVLELIPLTAAVFVALRSTLPDGVELAELRANGGLDKLRASGTDPVQREALPRVLAGVFMVPMLVAVSCITSLVIAYVTIYGFTPWGFAGYTRVVGQVFSPAISIILIVKTMLFSFAVSLIPMASALYDGVSSSLHGRSKAARELASMVRLFSVILLIEVVSLVGNYY
jgi:phospholipid/cholesterol/gamma-HCH transport system permease protein